MKWTVLLALFLLLVVLDKGLTIANIVQVNKNFPDAMEGDKYNIERNPLAKKSFEMYGLFGGTIIYGIVSILTMFLCYGVMRLFFSDRVSLYMIFMAYGLVIFNNLYFLFKYSRIIP
jgi:hypothetical protein|tara:strand:+ start:714 stop:1064 length:351 start_codon:yes stop_codon:yes gene_type:complete